jgi:nitrile hydratase accessory protein
LSAPETGHDFEEPWQAQAWVMARALGENGLFSLNEWSAVLGEKLRARPESGSHAYYLAVLEALEALVVRKQAASEADLAALKEEWREAYETTPHGKPVALRR